MHGLLLLIACVIASPAHDVTGKVVDAQTGAPIAKAAVLLEHAGRSISVNAADDGTFRFASAVPGTHVLKVGSPDHPVTTVAYTVGAEDESHEVTIELERQPKTMLTVVDTNARAVMLAGVYVFDEGGEAVYTRTAGDGTAPVFVPLRQEREVWVVARDGAFGVTTIASGATHARVTVEHGVLDRRTIPDEVRQALAGRGVSAP